MVDGRIAAKCLRLVSRLRNARERALFLVGLFTIGRHLPGEGTSESGVGVAGGDAEELLKIQGTNVR